MVASPYDPDVHNAKKRATPWIRNKVHLTETCDDAQPPLIVHVATTPAPIVDRAVLDPLHAALATKDLLPSRSQRRLLTPRSREEHDALVAARARETSSAFAVDRRRRAGIEGTLSRGVRGMGLRRSRYLGLARTHLQHLLTATAINLGRPAA